jgi:hypothetical protein
MSKADYTTSILVEETPMNVFKAITNVGGWWQGEIKGSSARINDEFSYRMEEFHFSKQKVVELIPNEKLVWLVTESQLNFVKDKDEWTGTKIIFEISEVKGKSDSHRTQIRFTHQGLVPKIECYGDCSNGWTGLIQKSLLSFITKGKGVKVF